MLKQRLFFGTLMTGAFTAIAVLDGWIDGSLTASAIDDAPVQGTVLFLLIAILAVPTHLEFSKLAAAKNLKVFPTASIIASVLLAGTWYWPQIIPIPPEICVFLVLTFALLGLFLHQYLHGQLD